MIEFHHFQEQFPFFIHSLNYCFELFFSVLPYLISIFPFSYTFSLYIIAIFIINVFVLHGIVFSKLVNNNPDHPLKEPFPFRYQLRY